MPWSIKKLGALGFDVRRTYKPNKEQCLPYIGYEHIEQQTLRIGSIGKSNETHSDKKKFEAGDILFGTLRPYFRKVVIPKFNGVCSTDLAVVKAREGYDIKFLYYILASQPLIDYANVSSNGTKMPRAKWGVLAETEWLVPDLPTQQKIAEILSAYDDLIEVNNKRIQLLEETARELYKEWFVRMRFPGWQTTKFKKGIPEAWEEKQLSQIADIKMGQSPKSEYYNEEQVGLPFHQGVGTYGRRFPNHEIYCSVNGRIAEAGDILFSVRAPVGRLNIADRKLIIGRGLSAIRHKKKLNYYLFYLLQNEFMEEDMVGNGSIFNSIGKDEFSKYKIFDHKNLAKKFNDHITPIHQQISNLYYQNTQLSAIRDRLLPRLISGKLQVSVQEEEPPQNKQHTKKKLRVRAGGV